MPDKRVAGIILAGGQSLRMGTDKALLPLGGRPLLGVLAEQMLALCDPLIVAAGDSSREAAYRQALKGLPVRAEFVPDVYADSGPLAGLHASLGAAPEGYAFVMACDMPFVAETLARRMLERIARHDGWAGTGAETGGAAEPPEIVHVPGQPFHALYHTRAAAEIRRMLEQGDYRLMGLLKRLSAETVEPDDEERRAFSNLNTPEAFERFLGERRQNENRHDR
ncbi:molybdenum cofactor guanylyltransferase [Paenibacillus humicola]|uniref:molybdenum cofactor guanylyltransferase n=1 Tax=Paenibacillus humicola TaxID=3110540 RepID=UPI00237AA26D|nr:molybdenum cofactor guanylyltransferase [Paenibacillus humicola]